MEERSTKLEEKRNRNSRKITHLLCKGGALVDLAGLLLALALEVVGAEAMPLLVQLYVIPLRLFTSKRIKLTKKA